MQMFRPPAWRSSDPSGTGLQHNRGSNYRSVTRCSRSHGLCDVLSVKSGLGRRYVRYSAPSDHGCGVRSVGSGDPSTGAVVVSCAAVGAIMMMLGFCVLGTMRCSRHRL